MAVKPWAQQVLIAPEASYGVPGAAGYVIPARNFQARVGQNLIPNDEYRNSRSAAAPFRDVRSCGVSFEHILRMDAVGWLLKYAMGAPTSITATTVGTATVVSVAGAITATKGGSCSGTAPKYKHEIVIDGGDPANPNTFKWRRLTYNADGTTTTGSWTTGVAITGVAQNLDVGVTVTFSAITGGTTNDEWYILSYGQNEHTFTLTTLPTGVTFENYYKDVTVADEYLALKGGLIESLKIPLTPAGPVVVSVDAPCREDAMSTSSVDATPTTYTGDPIDHARRSVLEYGGASIALLKGCEINLANNLDTGGYVCDTSGGLIYQLPEGVARVNGTLNAVFDSDDIYDDAAAFTERSLKVRWTLSNYYLELYVAELYLQRAVPMQEGKGGMVIKTPWEGHASSASGSALTAVLANDVAGY